MPIAVLKKRVLVMMALFLSLIADAQLQNDLSLPYLVREAFVKSSKPPIIILLHGYGSNEADLFGLQNRLPADFTVISVRAPMTLSENSFQWFRMETVNGVMQGQVEDLESSRKKIVAFIPQIVAKYKADPKQVFLCGFSQGAMMCYEVGLRSPELIKGIAPLSGKVFPSLKPDVKPKSALRDLKVFIGHGDADMRVAYTYATEANAYLISLGMQPEFHTYKGLGHSIQMNELADLTPWLQRVK